MKLVVAALDSFSLCLSLYLSVSVSFTRKQTLLLMPVAGFEIDIHVHK